jgi:hypothetical protein
MKTAQYKRLPADVARELLAKVEPELPGAQLLANRADPVLAESGRRCAELIAEIIAVCKASIGEEPAS